MRRFHGLTTIVLTFAVGCSENTDSPAMTSNGGSAGASAGAAGSGNGLAGGGNATGTAGGGGAASVAGSSGAATGGTAGVGGTMTGGQGGGAGAGPADALDGERWDMECTKAEDGNLCAVLPAGVNTCPTGGYTSINKPIQFGGTPGTVYDVTIRFQGTHEAGDYSGGTASPAQFLVDATRQENGLHTFLSLEVSAPKHTYFPNAGGGGGSVQLYDYMATIPIEGGATVTLKGYDIDCLMHRYCQDNNTNPCKGWVIDGISPAADPFDGAYLHMTVVSVVAK